MMCWSQLIRLQHLDQEWLISSANLTQGKLCFHTMLGRPPAVLFLWDLTPRNTFLYIYILLQWQAWQSQNGRNKHSRGGQHKINCNFNRCILTFAKARQCALWANIHSLLRGGNAIFPARKDVSKQVFCISQEQPNPRYRMFKPRNTCQNLTMPTFCMSMKNMLKYHQ